MLHENRSLLTCPTIKILDLQLSYRDMRLASFGVLWISRLQMDGNVQCWSLLLPCVMDDKSPCGKLKDRLRSGIYVKCLLSVSCTFHSILNGRITGTSLNQASVQRRQQGRDLQRCLQPTSNWISAESFQRSFESLLGHSESIETSKQHFLRSSQ